MDNLDKALKINKNVYEYNKKLNEVLKEQDLLVDKNNLVKNFKLQIEKIGLINKILNGSKELLEVVKNFKEKENKENINILNKDIENFTNILKNEKENLAKMKELREAKKC